MQNSSRQVEKQKGNFNKEAEAKQQKTVGKQKQKKQRH